MRVLRTGVPEPGADRDTTPADRVAPRDGPPARGLRVAGTAPGRIRIRRCRDVCGCRPRAAARPREPATPARTAPARSFGQWAFPAGALGSAGCLEEGSRAGGLVGRGFSLARLHDVHH